MPNSFSEMLTALASEKNLYVSMTLYQIDLAETFIISDDIQWMQYSIDNFIRDTFIKPEHIAEHIINKFLSERKG